MYKCVDCDSCEYRSEDYICKISKNEEECPMCKLSSEYDKAIIGKTTDGNIVYGYEKLIEICEEILNMNKEEAISHIDFNLVRFLPYLKEPKSIIMYEES